MAAVKSGGFQGLFRAWASPLEGPGVCAGSLPSFSSAGSGQLSVRTVPIATCRMLEAQGVPPSHGPMGPSSPKVGRSGSLDGFIPTHVLQGHISELGGEGGGQALRKLF